MGKGEGGRGRGRLHGGTGGGVTRVGVEGVKRKGGGGGGGGPAGCARTCVRACAGNAFERGVTCRPTRSSCVNRAHGGKKKKQQKRKTRGQIALSGVLKMPPVGARRRRRRPPAAAAAAEEGNTFAQKVQRPVSTGARPTGMPSPWANSGVSHQLSCCVSHNGTFFLATPGRTPLTTLERQVGGGGRGGRLSD